MDAPVMNPAPALMLASWLAFGAATGTAHFALLRWNTRLYLAGSAALRGAMVQLLRMLVTVAALGFAAWHGTAALLAAGVGLLLARMLVLRVMAPAP